MKFLGKELNIPRLVIAGATSGVGKTSITSAIIFGIKKTWLQRTAIQGWS